MECPKCQTDNTPDSVFCKKCATQLRPSAEIGISQTRTILKPEDELPLGSTFAKKYKIIEELGRGGMGIVYKAEDTKLKRPVALKFLPQELADDPEAKQRFLREAQAAAALSHPNICTIHEVEESGGKTFIAMEYIEGESLRERTVKKPLPVEQALEMAIQIAKGLEEAHKKGVVHRDIKSANIMVDKKGQAKIMDFGLAKVEGGVLITREARTMGTVAYMSPEQTRGEAVDHRSDIWSLGVVLYEILCGELPFWGERDNSIMYSIVHGEPRPLRKIKPDIPVEMERIIARAIKKDPDSRYQSAAEILRNLTRYRDMVRVEEAGVFNLRSFLRIIRKPQVAVPAVVAVLAIALMAFWFFTRQAKIRWAKEKAIPEIERLANEDKYKDAFSLVLEAEKYIGNDQELTGLIPLVSGTISMQTAPPGAEIYIKDYSDVDGEWESLGQSPVAEVRIPRGSKRWKVIKPGYETVEGVLFIFMDISSWEVKVKLDEEGTIPRGMVHVGAVEYPRSLSRPKYRPTIGRLRHLEPLQLGEYLLDKHEVTNTQYKDFIDSGGYSKKEYWKHEFIKNGRALNGKEAMEEFVDKTGRPGPATWEFGDFPEGQDNHPVSGINWYEAAAYAEFAGKDLPTVYHWNKAAGDPQLMSGLIVPLSNFGEKEISPVGKHQGVGLYGNYDMAGNVKEWCWNKVGNRRFILGGAWSESQYMFYTSDSHDPFSRSDNFGFRCLKYLTENKEPVEATLPVEEAPPYDFSEMKPCSDEVFEAYVSFYDYDKVELNPVVEDRKGYSRNTILEKVSFNAAYGNERVIAYLYLPRRYNPPYQAIILYPGGMAARFDSIDQYTKEEIEYFARLGRATVFPIYKGHFERRVDPGGRLNQLQVKERRFMRVNDLRVTIDYLETRPDFDPDKIALYGVSSGARWGSVLPAIERRIKAAILVSGGMSQIDPEINPINYAPRITIPVLMLNGKHDYMHPVETSQKVLFEWFGTPEEHKYHKTYETGHSVWLNNEWIKDAMDFLDKYFGPVK